MHLWSDLYDWFYVQFLEIAGGSFSYNGAKIPNLSYSFWVGSNITSFPLQIIVPDYQILLYLLSLLSNSAVNKEYSRKPKR